MSYYNLPRKGFSKSFNKYYDTRYLTWLYSNRHNDSNIDVHSMEVDLVIHPFYFLSKHLKNEKSYLNESDSFEELIKFKNILDQKNKQAYNQFELEYSLLDENRYKYINAIVSFLIKLLKELKSRTIYNDIENQKNSILINSIFKVLREVSSSHIHIYLHSSNRKFLSKWYNLKKPIVSFEMKIKIEEQRFSRLYYKYISSFMNTDFPTFKAFLNGKNLEKKINWTDDKSSLYTFIKLLVNSGLLRDTKNKHWSITAEFFLIKGQNFEAKDMVNHKGTNNKNKIMKLEKFIKALYY